jgi:hypothetical protein
MNFSLNRFFHFVLDPIVIIAASPPSSSNPSTQNGAKPLNASMAFSEKRRNNTEEESKLTLNFSFVCARRVEELRKFFFFSLFPSTLNQNTNTKAKQQIDENFLFALVIVEH